VPNELTPEEQQELFYSTIDEPRYVAYFEPFRKAQYELVLRGLGLPARRSLLDVGASFGWMVEVGLNLGFDSFGLEPGDVEYSAPLTSRIFKGTLTDYSRQADRKFDIVTAWHVLEHLPDPLEGAAALRELMSDTGRVVIAVPTTDGLLFRLALRLERVFKRKELLNELFYFHNPNMHFYYYNAKSLAALLTRVGLRPVSVVHMEAFDWSSIYRRVASETVGLLLRAAGPLIGLSGITRRENLIVIAQAL
jgi:hypothetical protein